MILSVIPHTQKRIGVDNWHRVLVELLYMEIALPGSKLFFSHMQKALCRIKFKRVNLTKGIHQALAYLLWLSQYLDRHITRLYELVPLQPTIDEYHDAFGYGYGWSVLRGLTAVLWTL